MTAYAYKALNPSNQIIDGIIDARDEDAAAESVKKQGLRLFELQARRSGVLVDIERSLQKRQKVKTVDVENFTRNMSTLLEAGLPLLKALTVLEDQVEKPAMREVIQYLRTSVQSGSSFSSALSKHPHVFNNLYVSMIEAGEHGGLIDVSLDRLADFAEKEAALKSKVKAALIYPALIVSVAFIVVSIIMAFVIPTFKELFLSTGKVLPMPTLILMAVSDFFAQYWWTLFVFGAAIYYTLRSWLAGEAGEKWWARTSLELPLYGTLKKREISSRFARTLGTLFQSGVPILKALEICKKTAGNIVVARATDDVIDLVSQGVPFGLAARRLGVFPPMMNSMITVGEETGALEQVLIRIADKQNQQVEVSVQGLLSVLEPAIILFMGILIGFIVIALFLPIITPAI